MAVEPDGEVATFEPVLDPALRDPLQPRTRRTRASHFQVPEEPCAEERAAIRKAARRVFRLYCFACGRSTEGTSSPTERAGRCPVCGGTMLLELAAE
ncbi:MAG: hypothetical protein LC797_23285 [Chloroflexi bacterium]|nr:hypothetical protein [Chloroflexota bacterium]